MVTGFTDRAKGRQLTEASSLTRFGKGGAVFLGGGNILTANFGSVTGISPGGLGADNVLWSYFLPANSLDIPGRTLIIQACGSVVNNANSKDIKLFFGSASATVGATIGASGVAIADTGVVTTVGGGFQLQATVVKTANNIQLGVHNLSQIGATSSALVVPSSMSFTDTAGIWVACTANVTTALSNVVLNFAQICAMD